MKSAIFITARTKSTRLPKKVLLEIKGKKIIEHLIERLKLAKKPDLIVLCTSTNPNDTVLIDIAKKNGIEFFAGSEDDVLDRFSKAADLFGVDFISVTWGDEPLCDPEYIDKTIDLYKKTNADLIKCNELPLGTFNYGVKVAAIKKICEMKAENDTEVWGAYFDNNKLFKTEFLKIDDEDLKKPETRMTIDYPEDFEFMKKIFDELYEDGKVFSLKDAMLLLKKRPDLMDINKKFQELYETNIKRLTKVKLKK
jgi:spore coat polysaccharide biosynthesis protein SpsF